MTTPSTRAGHNVSGTVTSKGDDMRPVATNSPRDIPLETRRVRLLPPNGPFIDKLYLMAATNQIPWQWSGAESPESFRRSLWDNVLAQFAVIDAKTRAEVGIVRADNANLHHGFSHISMMLFPKYRLRAWPLEAALLFGNYLFQKFSLQNLYAETPASIFSQFRSGMGRHFEVEACFKNRLLTNGEREDLYVLTFTRDRWAEQGLPALERLTKLGV
jgi:RimJ/RimL family protein N-acetyltransferase